MIVIFILIISPCYTALNIGQYYITNTVTKDDNTFVQGKDFFKINSPLLQLSYNSAPMKPYQPTGPLEGESGIKYNYTSSTTDPEGDDIYYLFDWGDGTKTGWIGPFKSGINVSISHIWNEKGHYKIKIIVKDINDLMSEWSDSLPVEIIGPYLTFKKIKGGLGLTTEIENIGDSDATDLEISIKVTGGLIVTSSTKFYEIPKLPPGESAEVSFKISGIGLGIITEFPNIKITTTASNAKTRGKIIVARVLGLFVKKVGEWWSDEESFEGYTLYSPAISTKTFLINNSGEAVHVWESKYKPALSVYLLENGCILRTALTKFNTRFWGGGLGSSVEIIDWNGTVVWRFDYSDINHCLHHDVKMLPNGNILMIAWEYKSDLEAVDNGRNPNYLHMGELWPNHIIEVEPTDPTSGDIVWEWHVWDHLIQDFDPSKENYGVVEDHPELVDINFGGRILADWLHVNSIDYNEEFDQIMICSLYFNEIWVIDHSTTTEEAAGHTGGNSGKGGDILYRWGNPQAYRVGDDSDRKLFRQHDAQWIDPDCPGEGNILVFNNGGSRPGGDYSSVDEIVPPVDSSGNYFLVPGSSYDPEEPIWTYSAANPADFYATNLAGAQRLPNGNTLICDGPSGFFFEVNLEKEIVWEYLNLVPNLVDNHVFKIRRYAPDYPGLRYLFE